ncbi:MAG: GtrA family protein [Syntrophobacteraceae bacterium]
MSNAYPGRNSALYTKAHSTYQKLMLLFRGKTNNTVVQFMRYTTVGGCAFVIDFLCLYILTRYFHIYYLYSAALGFAIGMVLNYLLSIHWVFDKRKVQSRQWEFVIFFIIGVGGLLLNEVFIWYFAGILLINYLIAKLLSTFFVYTYNFVVRKSTLFS